MLIPSKFSGYGHDGIRRACVDSGGGGSSTATSYQTNIPEYAKKSYMDLVGRASALYSAPYKPYTGERTAQFTPLQQQAFQGAQNLGVTGQTMQASGLTQAAAQRALGTQYDPASAQNQYQSIAGYNPSQFSNQFRAPQEYRAGQFGTQEVQAQGLQQYQMGPAQNVQAATFGGRQAAQYMSPFIQEALAPQMREAMRSSDIQRQSDQARAVGAGAFGGSRQALVEAERQRNLGTQLGDIQAKGLQSAYEQAQAQFNQDAARRLQAQQANQQAGLTVGQQNLAAQLGVQQLGAQTGLQAQLANQQAALEAQRMGEQSRQFGAQQGMTAAQLQAQYGLSAQQAQEAANQYAYGQAANQAQLRAQYGQAAQQLAEQSRQYGAGLGLQGLQTALQGAGQLGTLGQQQFTQQQQAAQLQAAMGGTQQQQIQAMLDQGYANYQAAQNYPYQQLGFMSDILRGTQGTTRSMYEPQASPMQQLIGAGTAMYGASRMFAKGGEVTPEYTNGGVPYTQGFGVEPTSGVAHNYAKGGETGSAGIDALAARMKYLPQDVLARKAQAAQANDLKGYLAAKIAEQEQQRIRTGAQAQQALNAPPPQGTVVQQDLANSGIAAVAPESAGEYADGGIVSFAGGGLMAYEQPYANLSDEEAAEVQRRAREEMLSWPGRAMSTVGRGWERLTEGTAIEQQRRREAAQRSPAMGAQADLRRADQAATPYTPPTQVALPGQTALNPFAAKAAGTTAGAGITAGAGAAPGATAGARSAGLGAIAPGGTQGDLAGVNRLIESTYGEQEQALRELASEERKAAEEERRRYDEDMAKLGTLGEKREARLKKEEEGLAGRKEEAKGHALMQAGLAILSADPKRGLAAAIGTGGQAGLAAYAKDADKLQAAQDKINDGLDTLDELRRAESMATGKERRGLDAAIRRTSVDLAKNLAALKGDKGKVSIETALKSAELLQKERLEMAQISAYRDVAATRGTGTSGVAADKQQLAELKVLGASLQKQLENPRLPKVDRTALQDQLRAVNASIAKMSGINVASTAAVPALDYQTGQPLK